MMCANLTMITGVSLLNLVALRAAHYVRDNPAVCTTLIFLMIGISYSCYMSHYIHLSCLLSLLLPPLPTPLLPPPQLPLLPDYVFFLRIPQSHTIL
jgi:hypothetical protein